MCDALGTILVNHLTKGDLEQETLDKVKLKKAKYFYILFINFISFNNLTRFNFFF